jgi:hypothetical protein
MMGLYNTVKKNEPNDSGDNDVELELELNPDPESDNDNTHADTGAELGVGSQLRGLFNRKGGKSESGEGNPEPVQINRIGGIMVKDHFSLTNPSSIVSFADDEQIVFVDNLEQVVLEKRADQDYFTAKQATVSSPGLVFTRFAYTLVAILMSGILFVFCIQIILFLFLGLAIESGRCTRRQMCRQIFIYPLAVVFSCSHH